jgi:hypothetical protein
MLMNNDTRMKATLSQVLLIELDCHCLYEKPVTQMEGRPERVPNSQLKATGFQRQQLPNTGPFVGSHDMTSPKLALKALDTVRLVQPCKGQQTTTIGILECR